MGDPAIAQGVAAANLRFARALVGGLHAAGVVRAVICPGSRSTPLALAIAERAGLTHSVHIDERSAAFYALGYAKFTGQPVLLLCTSGTAGANFLPAVAEAYHARVPLIVLTADRPPESRSWGASQTLEQRALYTGFTRWSEEAPCPSEGGPPTTYATALARRAVYAASGAPAGPVHLNLPFREPLASTTFVVDERPAPTNFLEVAPDLFEIAAASVERLLSELRAVPHGVLLFGPDPWDANLAPAAHALADSLGWPILADPASALRSGPQWSEAVISRADLLLREPSVSAALCPDLILRFGGQPTSAAVNAWIARHPKADVWLVDDAAGFRDPQYRATRTLRASPRRFCELAAQEPAAQAAAKAWLIRWQHANAIAQSAATAALAAEPRFLTPHIAAALSAELPDGAVLYAANSMAIRDVDTFSGRRATCLRLLANRGVNGIDGLVSCALGTSAAARRATVLWCGDLAFLHDVSGLLAGEMLTGDLTIVVSNDDGGGIFEYLPQAQSVPRALFERVFALPHGADLCRIARGFGWQAVRTDSAGDFSRELERALTGGRHVIEVPVERAANTAFHKAIYEEVAMALRREIAT
jgi:2-succinyl-5-enolpyruvyl-6-hydroxy-3-cyclohexene-1-carboxylate synthase